MQKKFYINANVERLISFLATLFLILTVNIVLTQTMLKKLQDNAESVFIDQYDDAVDGKLKQLESRIDVFYAKIAYKSFSNETIKKFLIAEKENIAYPFDTVVYADKTGMSWNSNGEEFDVSDRNYFKKIMSGETNFFVSNILEARHNGEACLVFARPVYDSEHEILGCLFAICPLERAADYFAEITNSSL